MRLVVEELDDREDEVLRLVQRVEDLVARDGDGLGYRPHSCRNTLQGLSSSPRVLPEPASGRGRPAAAGRPAGFCQEQTLVLTEQPSWSTRKSTTSTSTTSSRRPPPDRLPRTPAAGRAPPWCSTTPTRSPRAPQTSAATCSRRTRPGWPEAVIAPIGGEDVGQPAGLRAMVFSEETKRAAYERAGGRCECLRQSCAAHYAGRRGRPLTDGWHAHRVRARTAPDRPASRSS